MFERDDSAFLRLIVGIMIVSFIVYIIVILTTIIIGIAAAGGTLYGGGSAIKNYFLSFKENVIDENRTSIVTV